MTWQTNSTDSAATEQLGQLLAKHLSGGEVIELRSDLGGGKTTFVRGLVQGLGSNDIVSSPTFTINKIYKAKNGLEIHHFDFYRLNEPGIIADQLAESLNNPKVITVIEWSDIVKDVLPEDRLAIEFKPVNLREEERQITISYPESHTAIVKSVENGWIEIKP